MGIAGHENSPHSPAMVIFAVSEASIFTPYSPDLNPIEEFFAELKSFYLAAWPLLRRQRRSRIGILS